MKYLLVLMLASTASFAQENYLPPANNKQVVKIAIIDTGLNTIYKEMGLKLCKTGHYDFAYDIPEIVPSQIEGEHGTIIAGIIGGFLELQQVNYCLQIYNIYNETTQQLDISDLGKAINLAVKNGANVINYSLSGRMYSALEYLAIKNALSKGVKFVTAAGNGEFIDPKDPSKGKKGIDLTKHCRAYPACYNLPEMIVAGSLEVDGQISPSSNYGKGVNAWYTGVVLGKDGKEYTRGTSFATARATAYFAYTFALVLSK